MIIGPRERAGLTLAPVSGPQAKTTAASENPIATAATQTGALGSTATATMTRTRSMVATVWFSISAQEAADMTADSAAAVTLAETPLEWLSVMVGRNA